MNKYIRALDLTITFLTIFLGTVSLKEYLATSDVLWRTIAVIMFTLGVIHVVYALRKVLRSKFSKVLLVISTLYWLGFGALYLSFERMSNHEIALNLFDVYFTVLFYYAFGVLVFLFVFMAFLYDVFSGYRNRNKIKK